MKIKLLLISSVVLTALGASFLFSSTAHAAAVCGDTDFIGPCATATKVCDDKGFIGPCAATDYTKVDCDTAYTASHSYEGPSRCKAIKACIAGGGKAASCLTQWDTCRDKVASAQGAMKSTDRENCVSTVSGAVVIPEAADDKKTSCAIDGIGWIICPVMHFMSQIVDYAYKMVSSLLTTPAVSTDTNSSLYKAWAIMRNFANVAFVIAFLIIIYSQISSVGITNYGIKKMLPRLIIAAILVNVSYWICAIAVDISNILGSSLKGLLEGAGNQLYTPPTSGVQSGSGGVWDGLTVAVLAGAGGVALLYIGLSALLPLLLAALLAIITVVLVLTLRQALIIILIVVSPLAFVAYLFPNTESLFKKWKSLFQTLLLMFPIIAVIFGGSALASTIISSSAGGDFILGTMAAGVTIIPLFITPVIMKSAGGVLNRFGAIVNNPNKGPFDRMRKGVEGYRGNRGQYRQLKALNGYRTLPGKGVAARRSAGREAILNSRKSELTRAKASEVAGLALNNEKFAGKLAQGGGEGATERALAGAISVQAKLQVEEVSAASAIIKNANLEGDIKALQQLATGKEVTLDDGRKLSAPAGSALQTAAIQQQFKIGDVPSTDQLVMNSGSMGVAQRQAVADGMKSMSSKVKYYSGSASNAVAQGKINSVDANGNATDEDLNKLVADAVDGGKYGVEELANGDHDALARVANVTANPGSVTSDKVKPDGTIERGKAIADDKKQALREAATEIRTNDNIKNPSERVQARLGSIESGTRFPSPPTPPPPPPTP
jgi:hypothetical protein